MDFLHLLSSIANKIFLGLVLILTNTAASTPSYTLPTAPPILPPSGQIVLTPTITPRVDAGVLALSPFEKKPEPSIVTPTELIKRTAVPAPSILPKKSSSPKTEDAQPKVVSVPTPISNPPVVEPVPIENIPAGDLNTRTRTAVVNILCNVGGEGSLAPISGTGVIIDQGGIVLTNAHVGQFFLLRDYPTQNNVDCILRSGSPARATYRAELLYFPLPWMQSNAEKIVQDSPSGTGERDYAFLYITGRVDGTPLPSSFHALTPYLGDVYNLGDDILLAGYSAGFIEGITIQTNLFVSSAIGKINEIFTFKEGGGADLISVPGTVVSQKGASGGAAVRASDGMIVGIIATATQGPTTAGRDLRAITLAHVDRSLTEDSGHNLRYLLTNDPAATARLFNLSLAPTLTKMLTTVLNR